MIYATSESARLVTLIFVGLYTLSELVAVALVLRRRHLEPLKFRDPVLMLTVELLAYLTSMAYCLQYFYTVPSCLITELLVTPFLVKIPFILGRYWKIVALYQITWARLHPDDQSSASAWILRHTWLHRPRYLWAAMLAVNAVLVGVHAAVTIPSPLCFRSPASNTLIVTLVAMFTVCVTFLSYRLRQVQDAFFVARELQALGAIIVIGNLMVVFVGRRQEIGDLIHYMVLALFQAQNVVQMWYPIHKSFELQHDRDAHLAVHPDVAAAAAAAHGSSVGPSWTSTSVWLEPAVPTRLNLSSSLNEILHHPEGLAAFRQFLTTEFSVENLLCWEELSRMLRDPQPSDVRLQLQHVYTTFICDGAPNEVNISADLKNAFYEAVVEGRSISSKVVARVPPNESWTNLDEETQLILRLMKRLLFAIVKLMHEDSYLRFVHSDQYKKLIMEPTMASRSSLLLKMARKSGSTSKF